MFFLNVLFLNGDIIGDQGIEQLSSALTSVRNNLTEIYLSKNRIGFYGAFVSYQDLGICVSQTCGSTIYLLDGMDVSLFEYAFPSDSCVRKCLSKGTSFCSSLESAADKLSKTPLYVNGPKLSDYSDSMIAMKTTPCNSNLQTILPAMYYPLFSQNINIVLHNNIR